MNHLSSTLFVQHGTTPDEAVGAYTQPYIVHFKDIDDDENCLQQYFILVEHSLMLETHSFTSAVFAAIASYYVFNLSYHNTCKCADFWTFIQEYVLDLSAKGSKKSPTVLQLFTPLVSSESLLKTTRKRRTNSVYTL